MPTHGNSGQGDAPARDPFASDLVMSAAAEIFGADPRVKSVGVGRHGRGFGFVAIRNASVPVRLAQVKLISEYRGFPVAFVDSDRDPETLVKLLQTGPGGPTTAGTVLEQSQHRPVVCGLEVQNYDDDERTGVLATGYMTVGSVGCMVRLSSGNLGFLSNNHVVAGENRGVKGKDRILQAGGGTISTGAQVGFLFDFVSLKPSPPGATLASGTAILNDADAGAVEATSADQYKQRYIASRKLPTPSGTADARPGDKVFKVGRTTGLTRGEVTQAATIIGPIPYAPGLCWFRRSFVIQGENGTPFADHGDSGSAIVRDDGKVVGLLFAGNGQQTWACRIDDVLQSLNCRVL